VARRADELLAEAVAEVAGQGVAQEAIEGLGRLHLRYTGTDTALLVDAGPPTSDPSPPPAGGGENSKLDRLSYPFPREGAGAGEGAGRVGVGGVASLRQQFEALHRRRFGFVDPSRSLTVEAVSVEAAGGGADLPDHSATPGAVDREESGRARFFSGSAWHDAAI